MCSEGSELIQIHQFLDFCPVSLLPSGLIRLSSKHFKDVMPVTNYNSFPVAVLVFKSREIFKCRMCHLGSRAKCLPAPPSSLKPGFAVEFDAVTGLLAISLHCFPHVPSPLRIWLQGINLETSIGSEDRFASLSTVLWVMGSPWIRGPQALHFTQVFFHGPHGCHGRKAKKIFFFQRVVMLCIHERHESRVENPRTTLGQRKCSNNTWTCLKIGCSRPLVDHQLFYKNGDLAGIPHFPTHPLEYLLSCRTPTAAMLGQSWALVAV